MLKVSGKWLSPQEVENTLLQHDAVEEVAVIGVADADGLMQPHAFVVAPNGRESLEHELIAFAKSRMAGYKTPRTVTLLAELPRTHLGKVDRARLRDQIPAA